MRIPVPDGVADAATVAFGVRNVQTDRCRRAENSRACFGRADALRFSSSACPRIPGLAALYRWYFSRVLPLIGRSDLRPFGRVFVPSRLGRRVSSARRIRDTPETFGLCGRPRRPADFRDRLSLCGGQRTTDKQSGSRTSSMSRLGRWALRMPEARGRLI